MNAEGHTDKFNASQAHQPWKECKLGDVITLQRGHDLPKSKMMNGNIPVAGSNGIIGYHNVATTNAPGITIGRSGNLGIAYFYKEDFWAHNTTLYVKDFKGNNELFIYYFLKTFDFKQFNVGSAVPTLNRNHIHPLDVHLPPLPEQKAIASVLSSLDDKIDLLHRQNRILEAMAETLFRQWFVERRPELVEGEAEEDWEEGVLSDYCDVVDCLHSKKPDEVERAISSKYLLQVYNIGLRGEIDLSNKYYVKESDYKEWVKRIELTGGEIIISKTGRVAAMAQIPYFIKTGIGRNLVAIRKKDIYTNEFLKDLMLSSWMKRKIHTNTSDGTILQSIHVKSISNLPAFNPGKETIVKYSKKMESIHSKINQNIMQKYILEKLRDTLLPKLMSGEVRVEV